MKYVKRLSSKGQVVIPLALRQRFGLTPKTKLELTAHGGQLAIKPLGSSITQLTTGSLKRFVPKHLLARPWREIIESTKQLAAAELAREGTEQELEAASP